MTRGCGDGGIVAATSMQYTQHTHDLYMRDHSPHSPCTWLNCGSLSGHALTVLFQGLFCFVAVSREWVSVFWGPSACTRVPGLCVAGPPACLFWCLSWQEHAQLLPGCGKCKCCTGSAKGAMASAALMPACCCACAHHSRLFPQQRLLLPPPRCSALRCRLQAGLREAGKAMCLLTETQLPEPPAFIQMQPCWLASTVFVVTALMAAVMRPRECWRRCTTQLTRGQSGAL